ncbi:MAG: hypothetical protein U0531_00180 [Dehalococcoidia bacterium]
MSRAIVRALAIGEGNPALLDTATGALSREAFTLRVEEAAALAGRLGHAVSIVRIELSRPGDLRSRYGAESVDALLAEMVITVGAGAVVGHGRPHWGLSGCPVSGHGSYRRRALCRARSPVSGGHAVSVASR